MIRVTWAWLGADVALDVANTVTVSDGVEHDLLAPDGAYERWAAAAAASPMLDPDGFASLAGARTHVLRVREPIRALLSAVADGEPPPRRAIEELNRVSERAASWLGLDEDGTARYRSSASAVDRLLATYARSAIEIAAAGSSKLRRCPAPSCGMFYRPTRQAQRWCSVPCGTRARVARHARTTRPRGSSSGRRGAPRRSG